MKSLLTGDSIYDNYLFMKNDDFGDRMKFFESFETGRKFLPMLPTIARLDGRGFSKFTKGMQRPFDPQMTNAMIETTRYLVKETHALIGYCQSDEITLIWNSDEYTKSIFFDYKITKMTSVLSGIATAAFNRQIRGWQPYEDRYPHFDARVFQVPNKIEATNALLWRTVDCQKNSVSMATRAHFSAKKMHGKNRLEMLEMLKGAGVDFDAFPQAFRNGTFLKRIVEEKEIPSEDTEFGPGLPFKVLRSRIAEMQWPPFSQVANRTEVLFSNADIILKV
jgi:tRNA(His) 5'-end guanylyltransferase